MKIARFADSYFQVVLCIMLFALLGAAGYYTYEAEFVAKNSYSSVYNAVGNSSNAAVGKNFSACVAAGNPVKQTSPETCTTAAGQTFTQSQ